MGRLILLICYFNLCGKLSWFSLCHCCSMRAWHGYPNAATAIILHFMEFMGGTLCRIEKLAARTYEFMAKLPFRAAHHIEELTARQCTIWNSSPHEAVHRARQLTCRAAQLATTAPFVQSPIATQRKMQRRQRPGHTAARMRARHRHSVGSLHIMSLCTSQQLF